jgi:hypothetical protein
VDYKKQEPKKTEKFEELGKTESEFLKIALLPFTLATQWTCTLE